MQVAASININDVAGSKIAPNQKGNGIGDVLRFAVALERDSVDR
jgi:hypothetical protein